MAKAGKGMSSLTLSLIGYCLLSVPKKGMRWRGLDGLVVEEGCSEAEHARQNVRVRI